MEQSTRTPTGDSGGISKLEREWDAAVAAGRPLNWRGPAPAWLWGPSVRYVRERRGLAAAELGAAAACSERTVFEIEAGEHRPTDALKGRLSEALDVPTALLFPMDPPDEGDGRS